MGMKIEAHSLRRQLSSKSKVSGLPFFFIIYSNVPNRLLYVSKVSACPSISRWRQPVQFQNMRQPPKFCDFLEVLLLQLLDSSFCA